MFHKKCSVTTIKHKKVEFIPVGLNKKAALSIKKTDIDPDMFYVKVRAVTANVPNSNGDFFPEDEIRNNYKTFEGRGVFINHESDNVESLRGKIISADLIDTDPNDVHVVLALAIDEKAFPQLVHSIKRGYCTDVSMGATVGYSLCSVCNNKASQESEYCDHVKYFKGRTFSGKEVYEINKNVNFFEISWVTTGADRTAKIIDAIDINDLKTKMEVAASDEILINSYDNETSLKKVASTNQISKTQKLEQTASVYNNYLMQVKVSFKTGKSLEAIASELTEKGLDELVIYSLMDRVKQDVLGIKEAEHLGFKTMDGGLLKSLLDNEPVKPYNPQIRTQYKGFYK